MPRNLDRRIEALAPVEAPPLQDRLEELLEVNLADDTLAWVLGPDGTWTRVDGPGEVDTHLRLQELSRMRARRPG
jgi:polyphosphate kinase